MNKWRGEFKEQEPLTRYTSWRVGGNARQLYIPQDLTDLSQFLLSLPKGEPLLWLGLGSNTLVRDGGYAGTVIITQGALNGIQLLADGKVRAGAGVGCAQFARFCARAGLAGAEFFAGIPGTMGGALRMNAGCFRSETWEFVVAAETLDRQGETRLRLPQEFTVSYRHVEGLNEEWFVGATFQFKPGDKEQSLQLIRELLDHRAQTQPTGEHSCGSVFRNPPDDFAGRLIESCDLKGYTIGDAMISPKHANFIVNKGNAKSSDIEALMKEAQEQVMKRYNIHLTSEVHIVGEN